MDLGIECRVLKLKFHAFHSLPMLHKELLPLLFGGQILVAPLGSSAPETKRDASR